MSVVVKRLKSSSMEIYVKGAPEVMTDICERDSCKHSFLLACFRIFTEYFLKSLTIMMIYFHIIRSAVTGSLQSLARALRASRG
jgi:magnesium-transporting ATPase (P-type)